MRTRPKYPLLILLIGLSFYPVRELASQTNPDDGNSRIRWGLEMMPGTSVPYINFPEWYSPGLKTLPGLGSYLGGTNLLLLRTGLVYNRNQSISDLVLELDYNAIVIGASRSMQLTKKMTLNSMIETRYSWQFAALRLHNFEWLNIYIGGRANYRINTNWGISLSLTALSWRPFF